MIPSRAIKVGQVYEGRGYRRCGRTIRLFRLVCAAADGYVYNVCNECLDAGIRCAFGHALRRRDFAARAFRSVGGRG